MPRETVSLLTTVCSALRKLNDKPAKKFLKDVQYNMY